MALWVAVTGFQNEERVVDDVLNRPVFQLTERTNWLKTQVDEMIGAGVFQAVRIPNAALLTTGSNAPSVGDIVYYDETAGKYAKAIATTAVADLFTATNSAFAVGMLVSVNGSVGTLALYGFDGLDTDGAAWTLSDLLETDEVYRDGPYYLSNTEAGKLTAYPSGPAIYIGYFLEQAASLGTADFAILNPQYRDLSESHVHRAYPLFAQPAGQNSFTGTTPADTHSILGFEGETAPVGGDHVPRLVAYGSWTATDAAQYTIWLSDVSGTTQATSNPPTDFSDAYLHWSSGDSTEVNGKTRIWSYNVPVVISTKGLVVALENNESGDWDEVYAVGADTADKRTWILDVPTDIQGWLARYYRQTCDDNAAVDYGFSFVVYGGPHTSDDDRVTDTITVKCAEIHPLDYTGQPSDTDTLTIAGVIFEMDNTGSVTPGNEPVTIGNDADETYGNLLTAILGRSITGVEAVLDELNSRLNIATPATTTVSESLANATLSATVTGTGVLTAGGGSADLLVYDQYHHNLVTAAVGYQLNAEYWVPIELNNGLSVLPIPYDSDGTAASADTVTIADYWDAEIQDEAPGAYFKYSVGMHQSMNSYYPPIPVQAAALVLNGSELDSVDFFPNDPTYRTGLVTLYWYSNEYGNVPWPRDWVSISSSGSAVYMQNLLFHFVRMAIGNTGAVTSLQPAPNSPIRVVQCGTNDPATVGDLALDLDLTIEDELANLAGFQVFKGIEGSKLKRGPIVSKIVPGPGISISSSADAPEGQGVVTISGDDSAFTGEFEEVALENAKQELIGMFPYIKLLEWDTDGSGNIPTAFVAKFRVPHTLAELGTVKYRVIVYATVFGTEDIPWIADGLQELAGITFDYNVLPDYTAITPAAASPGPDAWNTLSAGLMEGTTVDAEIPFGKYTNPQIVGNEIYDAYDPMLIHNNPDELAPGPDDDRKIAQALGDPFPAVADFPATPWVRPGSLVGIRISRSNVAIPAQEYTHSIGFINLRWRLVSVS